MRPASRRSSFIWPMCPAGRIRSFNDWGDYSYGVYIYAFPIQQTLAFLFPGMSLAAMMASSALVSVAIAILSWKLIEERALALKGDFAAATSQGAQSRPRPDRRVDQAQVPSEPLSPLTRPRRGSSVVESLGQEDPFVGDPVPEPGWRPPR